MVCPTSSTILYIELDILHTPEGVGFAMGIAPPSSCFTGRATCGRIRTRSYPASTGRVPMATFGSPWDPSHRVSHGGVHPTERTDQLQLERFTWTSLPVHNRPTLRCEGAFRLSEVRAGQRGGNPMVQ